MGRRWLAALVVCAVVTTTAAIGYALQDRQHPAERDGWGSPIKVAPSGFAVALQNSAGPLFATVGPIWNRSSHSVHVSDVRIATVGRAHVDFVGWINEGGPSHATHLRYAPGFVFDWPTEFSSDYQMKSGPGATLSANHLYLMVVVWHLRVASGIGGTTSASFVVSVAGHHWKYRELLETTLCPSLHYPATC